MADTIRIERTTQIAAPPDRVLPFIEDFRQWAKWSPYEKLDANLKKTFGGAEKGVGATYSWVGNSKAGAGTMTIKSATASRIEVELVFTKPMKTFSTSVFELVPEGNGTRASWTMIMPHTFMTKALGLVMNLDKTFGKEFAEGLAQLKNVAEAQK